MEDNTFALTLKTQPPTRVLIEIDGFLFEGEIRDGRLRTPNSNEGSFVSVFPQVPGFCTHGGADTESNTYFGDHKRTITETERAILLSGQRIIICADRTPLPSRNRFAVVKLDTTELNRTQNNEG